ncbi:ATP-binding protein [Metapseudomonas boanensis]|uniref:Helix-turn-helix transcriptional regulator n=1 Tax=Metapseudomonas boanensis TaxID=2822138 RepID=A0ABS5XE65_9GAMM|nr:helix-turn-helix transcriptional regulator [Pseudomonas boanensis]
MNELRTIQTDVVMEFGPFHYYVQRRLILQGDRPLRLGSRALDILHLLLEHAGNVVSKETILARVWPTTVVEEINLRVHIAALRRALSDGKGGKHYIANIPQRGYSFIADVQLTSADELAPHEPNGKPLHNLPGRLSPIFGRDAVVDELIRKLPTRRLMTLVGAGGMGKTTIALRLAELLLPHYHDGVYLIDLSVLVDPTLVAAKVARTLGLAPLSEHDPCDLGRYLNSRHLLLVLDNCEHLIENCAALIEGLLRNAPRLTILATSREPLLTDGECVQRLDGLTIPPRSLALEAAIGCSAVQLFVARVEAHLPGFVLREQDVAVVIEICRRLDGIPLAIELAAAQVGMLGLRGLLGQLEHCLQLLTHGRRTAASRHQSLRATLDWSYALLSPSERTVLQRFSVFKAALSLDMALSLINCMQLQEAQVFEAITQLVAKSWLEVEMIDSVVHYRLLNTSRTYALEMLRGSDENRQVLQRYAGHKNMRVIQGGYKQS